MKYTTEFRNNEVAQALLSHIRERSRKKARFMEFCGGHTVAIFRYGIRQLLPKNIEMISGPGCPVCVTATVDIDKAIALAQEKGVIITTFGDMLKVPGSKSSLQKARAAGADVRMVYSTLDALQIAKENPEKSVVFLGIGFETTAPTVAASILEAQETGVKNYYVLSQNKLSPPAIKAILQSGEVKLDGLICPGHVSAITGAQAWDFIAHDYRIPCVVAGFEPLDVLQCIDMLVEQVENKQARVEIAYRRGVAPEGNKIALDLMSQVYEPAPAQWRGFGVIPGSGLKIKKEYRQFDAEEKFEIKAAPVDDPKGCLCGEVLRGVNTPLDCKLFGKVCNPESPVGPCMVSSEGTCSAYFLYGGNAID
ncbi:MAG: hydrogenase formation protein HypD [Dehalococcoidales bacterium]|nr:hydrogenase formation protein HypD [Dehalococcoidales bacterium]